MLAPFVLGRPRRSRGGRRDRGRPASASAFTHPLLASTVYSTARAARRRELHRLLAEVIDDEEQRAYHLARGTEAPDREIAVAIELAARAAARRGAPETAAELLEHGVAADAG